MLPYPVKHLATVLCLVFFLVGCGRQEPPAQAGAGTNAATQPVAPDSASVGNPQGNAMVKVSVFNAEGKLVGPVESPKVVKTDSQWLQQLGKERYTILRNKGTERAFCGTLLDNKKVGVYTCAGCGLPLFSSDAKFNSGTGWPSFFQPIAKGNVLELPDNSYGMVRTEILCARCDGHLGHVFDDGPRPTGLRFCLNSESLNFTESDKLATLADPAAVAKTTSTQAPAKTATAVLAGGCFWCTEYAMEQVKAVIDVESGYAGGTAETANYDAVKKGNTGHAEVIKVTYDPTKLSYSQLLDVFFDAHDPTTLNRQGADVGTQYRSAIFYADEEQKRIAEAKIKELTEKKKFSKPIVTTLEPLTAYYVAEAYHQDYARQNPEQPYIKFTSTPKAEKMKKAHPDKIKPGE